MRTIVKALIITSALVTGGAAYASDSSDDALPEALNSTEIDFAVQSRRTSQPNYNGREVMIEQQRTFAAPPAQGLAPVQTQNIGNGSNN